METVLDHYYDLVIEPRIEVDSVLINQVYTEIREISRPDHGCSMFSTSLTRAV